MFLPIAPSAFRVFPYISRRLIVALNFCTASANFEPRGLAKSHPTQVVFGVLPSGQRRAFGRFAGIQKDVRSVPAVTFAA